MHGRTAEAGYCGLYKTGQDHHWVVVWEEFCPWLERTSGQTIPFPTDDWPARAKVVSAFFRRVLVKNTLPEVAMCEIRVGLCARGPDHLHVLLENVVLKEGVGRE